MALLFHSEFHNEVWSVDLRSRGAIVRYQELLRHEILKKYLEASPDYQQVGRGYEAVIRGMLALALAYHRGDLKAAARELEQAVQLAGRGNFSFRIGTPATSSDMANNFRLDLAVVRYLNGDSTRALALLEEIKQGPIFVIAQSFKGRILAEGGDYDTAAASLGRASNLKFPAETKELQDQNAQILKLVEKGKEIPSNLRLSAETLLV